MKNFTISGLEFSKFTKEDLMAFSGVEGKNPLIRYPEESEGGYTILIDNLTLIYIGGEK